MRTEQIRQYSAQEDHVYSDQAVREIERQFWTLRDGAWLGKMDDGTIVRLETPHITKQPLPSKTFYVGWHLQLTLTSDTWRTYPPSQQDGPFEAVYAITRRNDTNWNIEVTQGSETNPLNRDDALKVEATDN
jgi:hypothetical protein